VIVDEQVPSVETLWAAVEVEVDLEVVVEEETLEADEVVVAFVLVEDEVAFVEEDETDEELLLDTPQVPEAGWHPVPQ
jgi:hypothetical protein